MKFRFRIPLWVELAAAVLAALFISNLATFLLLDDVHSEQIRQVRLETAIDRTIAMASLLQGVPPSMGEQAARAASGRVDRFSVTGAASAAEQTPRLADIESRIKQGLGETWMGEIRVRLGAGRADDETQRADRANRTVDNRKFERLLVDIQVGEGRWLNARFGIAPLPSLAPPWGWSAAIAALALIGASIWMGVRVGGPVNRLRDASAAMRIGETPSEIPVSGPAPLREAVSAFNAMSQRLMATLKSQRALIAAIAHDLRTPITSLKLRSEFIADEELRERMRATIDELQSMTEAVLEAARADFSGEPARSMDIAALVDSLCEDLNDIGLAAVCEPSDPITVVCRPNEIRRAVRNLVENAARYGKRANVRVATEGQSVTVSVADEGPGIPEAELENVFKPFSRLESSRSKETGGHGLGLTIARAIARSHGGDVTLSNRPQGGLLAVLRIPLGEPA